MIQTRASMYTSSGVGMVRYFSQIKFLSIGVSLFHHRLPMAKKKICFWEKYHAVLGNQYQTNIIILSH